jgi:hypothetical protein
MNQPPYLHHTTSSPTHRRAGHAGTRRTPPRRRRGVAGLHVAAAGGAVVGTTAALWAADPPDVPLFVTFFVAVAAGALASHRATRRRPVRGLPGGRRAALGTAAYRVAAAIVVLLVLPLLVTVALAVELTSRGPVLLRRARAGAGPALTFRCTDEAGRTTRLGRLLQRSSLDELPGLLDVVAGRVAVPGLPLSRSETVPGRPVRGSTPIR